MKLRSKFETASRCRFTAAGTPVFAVKDGIAATEALPGESSFEQLVLDVTNFPNTETFVIKAQDSHRTAQCIAFLGMKGYTTEIVNILVKLGASYGDAAKTGSRVADSAANSVAPVAVSAAKSLAPAAAAVTSVPTQSMSAGSAGQQRKLPARKT